MAVRFGSELVAESVYAVLSDLEAVTDAVTTILNLSVVPRDVALPVCLHYLEVGTYDGPIGQAASSETLRYVVRFVCAGESTDPIKAAAEAAFDAFDGHETDTGGAWLGFAVTGEWPLTTVLEGDTVYRQLGMYLSVSLTQGA